jgi:signal-transduction protein with cAMP-binding, CBS, and nucleotidyltransferase domain
MEHKLVILDDSVSINEVARAMEANGVTSILVRDSESGSVTGIVTERDIIYRAVAKSLGMYKAKIKKIMSTPLITVDKHMSCIEAIRIMREKGLRRLPILEQGNIIGMVTLMSLAGNVPLRNIDLVELEKPQTPETPITNCPYCESEFSNKIELSKHIDRIHLGSGLLEGDVRKWK